MNFYLMYWEHDFEGVEFHLFRFDSREERLRKLDEIRSTAICYETLEEEIGVEGRVGSFIMAK